MGFFDCRAVLPGCKKSEVFIQGSPQRCRFLNCHQRKTIRHDVFVTPCLSQCISGHTAGSDPYTGSNKLTERAERAGNAHNGRNSVLISLSRNWQTPTYLLLPVGPVTIECLLVSLPLSVRTFFPVFFFTFSVVSFSGLRSPGISAWQKL